MNEWIQRMLEQEAKNQEYLERLEKELAHAPEGDLRLSTYRGAARYYRSRIPGSKARKNVFFFKEYLLCQGASGSPVYSASPLYSASPVYPASTEPPA